jgi:hypothetical protein
MIYIALSLILTCAASPLPDSGLPSTSNDTTAVPELERGWRFIPANVVQSNLLLTLEYCGCCSAHQKQRELESSSEPRGKGQSCGSPKTPCLSTTCRSPKSPCASTKSFCAQCLVRDYKGLTLSCSYDSRCDCFTNYNAANRFTGTDSLGNYNSACECSGDISKGFPAGSGSSSCVLQVAHIHPRSHQLDSRPSHMSPASSTVWIVIWVP